MEAWKKEALEKAGYAVGDAEDFLELTDEERRIVEVRVALANAIRTRRKASKMTQEQLAERIGTNQPRVVKIEAAAKGVSLDQMFKGLFAAGGSLADLVGRRAWKSTPARKAKTNAAKKPSKFTV